MRNLVGEFRHKLDAKGRLSLPADFRRSIPEVLMVTQAPTNDHLMVYDVDGFGAWVDSLFEKDGGYSSSNSKHIAQRRVLNSRAKRVELDGSGRIGISAELRAAADVRRSELQRSQLRRPAELRRRRTDGRRPDDRIRIPPGDRERLPRRRAQADESERRSVGRSGRRAAQLDQPSVLAETRGVRRRKHVRKRV